jgi:hypothetical protein
LKPESKFWKEWKAFTPKKVTTGNSVRLSPHQISFHIRHPENTFILVKSLASSISKLDSVKLYEGKNIKELAARGLQLDACCLGLEACRLHLEQLGA